MCLLAISPLVLLGSSTTSGADDPFSVLGRFKLDCPLCGQAFTTVTCAQTNTREGVDRDLFARALGPQPEFYRIATCPRCGYSGYETDFDEGVVLPPDFRDRVLKSPRLKLPAGFGLDSDPRELDAADRYALAITCYQWRGRSDEALGWLHLRASWIAREEGSVLPPEPRLARVMKYIERWRPALEPGGNQADLEMRTATRIGEALVEGRFNRYQQPFVELALAMILRRHGENHAAQRILDRLVRLDVFPTMLREGIERMRRSISIERRYQSEAAELFEQALLAGGMSPMNRGPACYLVGELYRRLGREREAVRWFDEAIRDSELPDELRSWARQQREWCQSG
ncbi:MAG: hypothetical protein AMXMBFR13_05490 [Phycisphaerae bacterium]